MDEKPDCKPKETEEKPAPEKTPEHVAHIEIPVTELVQVDYTDEVPPGPPGLEIHPRRPLPPLPEAKPESKKPPERQD